MCCKNSYENNFFRSYSQKYKADEGGMSHHTVLTDKLGTNKRQSCLLMVTFLSHSSKTQFRSLGFPLCKMEAILMYPPHRITVD